MIYLKKVKGDSFLLWMLDCFPPLNKLVLMLQTCQEVRGERKKMFLFKISNGYNFFSIGPNDLKFCRHGGVYISSMPAKFQIIRTNRKKVMAKWWNPPTPRVLTCFRRHAE